MIIRFVTRFDTDNMIFLFFMKTYYIIGANLERYFFNKVFADIIQIVYTNNNFTHKIKIITDIILKCIDNLFAMRYTLTIENNRGQQNREKDY